VGPGALRPPGSGGRDSPSRGLAPEGSRPGVALLGDLGEPVTGGRAKADNERARDAVAQLHKDMAEKAAALPPTHTPVSVLFDESEEETQELK